MSKQTYIPNEIWNTITGYCKKCRAVRQLELRLYNSCDEGDCPLNKDREILKRIAEIYRTKGDYELWDDALQ